jgi:hypothetical protein
LTIEKVDSSTYARFLASQPIEEAVEADGTELAEPSDDRAWRAFMHAHHQLGVHLNRGLQE